MKTLFRNPRPWRLAGSLVWAMGLPMLAQSQTLTKEQWTEITTRASQLRNEAQKRIEQSCGPVRETITVPAVHGPSTEDIMDGKAEAGASRAGSKPVTLGVISWTGGCKDGVRDGEGTLSEFSEDTLTEIGLTQPQRTEVVSQGLVVMGHKLGPWRFERHTALTELAGVYVIHGLPEGGYFLKQADGSFQPTTFAVVGGSRRIVPLESRGPVSVAQVETAMAQTRRRWELAASGLNGTETPPAMTIESSLLTDLLKGKQARLAANRQLGDTRGKGLVVVLSNRTMTSLDRMDEFGRIVNAWAAEQSDASVRNAASSVARVIDKKAFVEGLTLKLRERFKSVSAAEDLSGMAARPGDMALVLDVVFEHQAQEFLTTQQADAARSWADFSRRYSKPEEFVNAAPAIKTSVSFLILNDQLEVVMSHAQNPQPLSLPRAQEGSGSNANERRANGLAHALDRAAFSLNQRFSHAKQTRHDGQLYDNINVCDWMFQIMDANRTR